MPENIKSIEIKGQFFDNTTILPIFNNEKNRMSIIYGRNGSGKSSLARAFYSHNNNNNNNSDKYNFEHVELKNYKNDTISNGSITYNTYVFDEEFINKNIDIKEDGLDSIVMFGKQVEIDGCIEENKMKIKRNKDELKKIDHILENWSDKNSTESPEFYIERINNFLREDGSWAERDKEIKGNKQKSRVSMREIKDIVVKFSNDNTKKKIEDEFNQLKTEYDSMNKSDRKIEDNLHKINMQSEINKINTLLQKVLDCDSADDKKYNKVRDMIKIRGTDLVKDAYRSFGENREDLCPYCFREISEDYVHSLLNIFDNIVNEEVEDYIESLKSSKISLFKNDFEEYKIIDSILCKKLKTNLENINKEILNINKVIDEKAKKPFNLIEYKFYIIENDIENYNRLIENMKERIENYNKKLNSINEIKEKLIKLNKEWAYLHIKDDFKFYKIKKEKINQKKIEKDKIIKENKDIQEENRMLNAKKNNIEIAVDVINNNLSYIFYDKDRLKLETDGKDYLLKVRGKKVTPNKVSVGERNALALCYYFTTICENLEENRMYEEKSLLVIDDPISSFDSDNRIGTLSYLNKELRKIITANNSTRVIIMSHDILVIDSIIKIGDDIRKILKISNNKKHEFYTLNKLEKKEMKTLDNRTKNEYSFSLNRIYDFIFEEEDDLTIGNTMRRVLEAFSTFQYKISMNQLLIEDEILETIENKQQREKLENYMSRIMLNDESHAEMRVKDIDNINLPQIYSIEEKRRTSKAILCLMFLLNPNHIKYHLSDDKLEDIEAWCREMTI